MFRRYGVCILSIGVVLALCTPALAAEPKPGWQLTSTSYPTNLSPGGKGLIEIDVYNVGAAASNGTVTVTDVLPPGLTAIKAGNLNRYGKFAENEEVVGDKEWNCKGATVVTCMNIPAELPNLIPGGEEEGEPGQPAGSQFLYGYYEIGIEVAVSSGASSGESRMTASGGGAMAPAQHTEAVTVGSSQTSFGFAGFNGWFSSPDGTLDTQAGSHPYELTIDYRLNTTENAYPGGDEFPVAGGETRDIAVSLPPGVIADPLVVPRCPRRIFDKLRCPASTQVGVESVRLAEGINPPHFVFPVYNLTPPPGIPAQFAFNYSGNQVFFDSSVRTGSDYGITTNVNNIPERGIVAGTTIIWGMPAEASHDFERRGPGCETGGLEGCASGVTPTPFLTLPTSCEGPQTFSIKANIWEDEATTAEDSFLSHGSDGVPTGLTGCDRMSFDPSISLAPDTSFTDTPAGLSVDVKASQEALLSAEGVVAANIRDTTVALPQGVVVNPGQAAGLAACQSSEDGIGTEGPPACPNASKVGTDAIETPLLSKPLSGNVYLLQSNPPDLKLLVTASGEGVNLKVVGDVHLNEATGQLVTTFSNTPELPFTSLHLSFSGGAQAALATPTTCGTYTATSDFTSWASPFISDVFPTGSFAITGGTDGAPCPPSPLPFTPSLIAGSTTDQAGGFTSFSLLLRAPDDQQRIERLRFKVPEGLLGMISKVPLCPEQQAQEGTCSATSQIGHTVVASGPGPYPLVVPQPGQSPAPIYLTGPYKGAPYGLSIVVPVHVGPFVLQTQIVRAKIEVDPLTAQIMVTTDGFPQVIDGIPTDLRTINAVIDRSEFMFNPTSCSPMSFSGSAYSSQGASAPISSHFQMGSCRSLTFKPNFKVSTSGKTSRANGASLVAKIIYPTGALGDNQASSQSNIKSVKVDLPKQLPSRLTTLQKACPVATFDANPAGCPKESIVGHASAVTPVLPVTLTGPAYFVSHAGEEFPQLIVVLQGYGVTVDLIGDTFIDNKTNITSSTFKEVPDVPITSFELTLPQGKFSALAAVGNLCKTKLAMPTTFTGQNGAVIKQSTPISVTGCAKAKTKKAKVKQKGKKANAHHKTKKK